MGDKLIFSFEDCKTISITHQTSFGGREFNPTEKEYQIFGKIVKNLSIEQAEKLGLKKIVSIPGMSVGQSLYRLGNHYNKEFDSLAALTIEKYDKQNIGKEGAVKVTWWMEKEE